MQIEYLLDADVFSALAKETSPTAAQRLSRQPVGSVGLSVVTLGEIDFGLERQPVSARLAARIDALRRLLPGLAINPGVVAHYAKSRAHLQQKGTPIGHNDLWLASHALAAELTVVTGNERELKRVPGLKVENWLR